MSDNAGSPTPPPDPEPPFPTIAGGPRDSEASVPAEQAPPQLDGVALVKAGNLVAAEEAFRNSLRSAPGDAGVWHNLAVVLARQGKLAAAVEHFQEALRLKPDGADTHRNLALALCQQGKRSDGESHWREALRLDPGMATGHHELGNSLRISGRLEEAVFHLREAVRLKFENPEAHQDLGMALAELKQTGQARESYETALRLRPDFPEAQNNLGILLEDKGDHAGAEALYRSALQQRPRSADTLNNLGVSLAAQRRFEEAAACYRQVLEINPSSAMAWNNLGNALRSVGQVEESLSCLRKAISFRADYSEAHNNLGIGLMQLGRRDEAMDAYEMALHLRPDYPEAHLNRSLGWLGEADFARGWTEYEWRWSIKPIARRPYPQPLWSGARAPEKTLFIYFEQGLGDTLQFVRYIELARRKVRRIVVEVQAPLVPLISQCPGIDEVIPSGATPPPFDLHIPLMSLPGAFGTRLETIPDAVPYLVADPGRVRSWKERLAEHRGFRVGVAWQGNPEYRGDRQRSIALNQFLRLAGIPKVRLISLQRGFGAEQAAALPDPNSLIQFDDLDATGGAFMDTAAVLQSLDLVVTSDTALAHLAGGLGAEVWVALPFAPDWRWLRQREDSPWYPTMTLFRQKRPGDWDEVFERITAELTERAADTSSWKDADAPSSVARAEFEKGTQSASRGQHDAAMQGLTIAIELSPNFPEAHHNLGVVFAQQARRDDAIESFRRALRLRPGYGEAAGNLGLAYLESGRPDKAVSVLRHAARCGHDRPDVFNHLGVALYRTGHAAEAIEAYRTALRLSPGFAPAHINLAQAHLALEQFQEAWLEMEWKWTTHLGRRDVRRTPRWNGEPLDGRTILVYADEAVDDVIQHLRFIRLLKDRGGRIVIACPPALVPLVRQPFLADSAAASSNPAGQSANSSTTDQQSPVTAVPINSPLPRHDTYVPLLSLPWQWMKSNPTIPTSVPYLAADPELRAKNESWFRGTNRPLGLWWPQTGKKPSAQSGDWIRDWVIGACQATGTSVIDIVTDLSGPTGEHVLDHGLTSADGVRANQLPELAAAISHLDLLITRDPTAAHLAGAMGISVCLLLPRLADSRWPRTGSTSPWYPTMRLLRISEEPSTAGTDAAESCRGQLVEALQSWQNRL